MHSRLTALRTQFCSVAIAMAGTLLLATHAGATTFTVTGNIICDNEVMIFTAANELPGMVVNYQGVNKCFSATPATVNFATTDRHLYLTCFSDKNVAQGLLHNLKVNNILVPSGDPQWQVMPSDSNVNACFTTPPVADIAAAMAARIPAGLFVSPAVGCQNGPSGCYGVWGNFTTIGLSFWTWYNSGQQVSTNAPFQPGFNHREFPVFHVDMLQVPTATQRSTWSSVKSYYR